jgi:hypothetical protein
MVGTYLELNGLARRCLCFLVLRCRIFCKRFASGRGRVARWLRSRRWVFEFEHAESLCRAERLKAKRGHRG